MRFALTVTPPDAPAYVHDPDGPAPETRFTAAVSVLHAFTKAGLQVSIRERKAVGRELLHADIGTPVTHEATGYTFTIKEI